MNNIKVIEEIFFDKIKSLLKKKMGIKVVFKKIDMLYIKKCENLLIENLNYFNKNIDIDDNINTVDILQIIENLYDDLVNEDIIYGVYNEVIKEQIIINMYNYIDKCVISEIFDMVNEEKKILANVNPNIFRIIDVFLQNSDIESDIESIIESENQVYLLNFFNKKYKKGILYEIESESSIKQEFLYMFYRFIKEHQIA